MPETETPVAPPHDPELDEMRLGPVAAAFVSWEPSGGKCKRQRCREDAPQVTLMGKVVRLNCAKHEAEEAERQDAEDSEAAAAACIAESGMTPRMREWTFATYKAECGDDEGMAALSLAQIWVDEYIRDGYQKNLLMWGPVGCGKTGLAWSMVRALCEAGYPARIANFARLLDAIRACYSKKIPTTHALEVNRVPILVLDDLGAERPTEWACGELLGIVDMRYERGLPTIYVSNYGPKALAKRLGRDDEIIGQRIVSRMAERAIKFEFVGGDRRLAA